jgi:hypothetical protein
MKCSIHEMFDAANDHSLQPYLVDCWMTVVGGPEGPKNEAAIATSLVGASTAEVSLNSD